MSGDSAVSIWDKLDYDLVEQPGQPSPSRKTPRQRLEDFGRRRRTRASRYALDAVGTAFWLWVFLKLFIADVDRYLIRLLAPRFEVLVDLRFFVFLAVFAIAVLALRRRHFFAGIVYVAVFPLVVVLWKIPKALFKAKSWVVFLGVVEAVTSIATNIRSVVVTTVLSLFSALIVIATDQLTLVSAAVVVLALILAASLFWTARYSLKPSRFLRKQEEGMTRLLDSQGLRTFTAVGAELRGREIERFDAQQQNQFLMHVAGSVFAHRLLQYWAFQLDEYRRSPAALLYSSLAYVLMLVASVASLTLINVGIYKVDPSGYVAAAEPSVLVFARYTFASLYAGEIAAVQASSELANLVSVVSTFVGLALLAGVFTTLVLSFRREKQDAALLAAIARVREAGRRVEERHRAEYEIGVDEAMERLEDLQYGLIGVIRFFASRTPRGY